MRDTEILIGDIVELSPSKMSTLDDIDLEKCTVLELDKASKRIKVVFNNYNSENETFFNKGSVIDWFSEEHVIDLERDYKVIEITDNQDTITGQDVCIITMAKLKKTIEQTRGSYKIIAVVDERDMEKFIFAGFAAHELRELEGTINRISFSNYKLCDAGLDDVPIKCWKPKNNINSPDDIFTMWDLIHS